MPTAPVSRGAEGAGSVVDVLQDELVDPFEVVEVEIACYGLCFAGSVMPYLL